MPANNILSLIHASDIIILNHINRCTYIPYTITYIHVYNNIITTSHFTVGSISIINTIIHCHICYKQCLCFLLCTIIEGVHNDRVLNDASKGFVLEEYISFFIHLGLGTLITPFTSLILLL